MTPKEALDILDGAVAQLNVPRVTHVRMQEAVAVLKKAIEPKEEKKEKK